MRLNSVKWAKALLPILFSHVALAEDFQFFQGEIDYWKDKKPATSQAPVIPQGAKPSTSSNEKPEDEASPDGPFPWAKYLDPKNKEFFKEGDYTPPEPFMEIVRNPSDRNLKLWFSYMDKKNELSTRLQIRMQEYVQRQGISIEPQVRESVNARIAALPKSEPEAKRYRFRMYFDSHCPHCKRMFSTMESLQDRGFYVEGLQVDGNGKNLMQANFPTSPASPADLKSKDIQSVPQLFVGDMKKKIVFKLSGYQSVSDVYQAIQAAEAKP